jgi:hypothetical protein
MELDSGYRGAVADGTTQPPFALIQRPLEAQIRALNVAVRASAPERAWRHAAYAVSLINEATDLTLTAEDLLRALLQGAESGRSGQEVLDALLELGVQRRLLARGSLVEVDGVRRFTREEDELRTEVRQLLGERDSDFTTDPRWRDLLSG